MNALEEAKASVEYGYTAASEREAANAAYLRANALATIAVAEQIKRIADAAITASGALGLVTFASHVE